MNKHATLQPEQIENARVRVAGFACLGLLVRKRAREAMVLSVLAHRDCRTESRRRTPRISPLLKRLLSHFSLNFDPQAAELRVDLLGAFQSSRDMWKNVFTPYVLDKLRLR